MQEGISDQLRSGARALGSSLSNKVSFVCDKGELLQRSGSCELRCGWLAQVRQTSSLIEDSFLHCATVRGAEDVQTPSVFVSQLLVRVAALPLPLFSRPRDFVP